MPRVSSSSGSGPLPVDGAIDQVEGRSTGPLLPQCHQPGEVVERDHLVAATLLDITAVQVLRFREPSLALAEVSQPEHEGGRFRPLLERLLHPPRNPLDLPDPPLLLSLRITSSTVGTRASWLFIPFQSCSHRSSAASTRPVRARNRIRGR